MAHNDTDRRRFLLATAMTLLALPALWWANKQSDAGAPNVATVGIEVASGDSANAGAVIAPIDAGGDPEHDPCRRRDVADAADHSGRHRSGTRLPRRSERQGRDRGAGGRRPRRPRRSPRITTKANYRSTISPVDSCFVAGVETGTRITVDEPRQRPQRSAASPTACTPTASEGIVLHTTAFAQIADLTDAPIPVDITS